MRDFEIEKNLAIKAMNYLESVTGKMMSEMNPALEGEVWACIDAKNEKELRRLRFNLEQMADDHNFDGRGE